MKKDLLFLHVAVLLFGLSGLFGKLVHTSAEIIVSGRVISASIFLYLVLKLKKEELNFKSITTIKAIVFQGALLFAHWFSFFQAIKLSTVALGLLSFSSFPIFTTFMEPFFLKVPLKKSKILTAFITLLGIAIVTPVSNLDSSMLIGLYFGIFSGFSFALLAIVNKKLSKNISGIKLTFYQCFGAALCSLPILFKNSTNLPIGKDLFLLVILGVVFTGIAHTMFVLSLKRISASTVSVTTCLEPVYGIIFAAFILGEIPTLQIVLGSSIIIFAAFSSSKE